MQHPILAGFGFLFISFCVGVYVFWRNFKKTIYYRAPTALGRAPRVAIADAGQGQTVKVQGRVEIGQRTLEAPLSGKRCVSWRVRVQEEHTFGNVDGPGTLQWETIVEETASVDFRVRDDSGVALVLPDGAEVLFDWDERYGEGMLEDESNTPRLLQFMRKSGRRTPACKVRYEEGSLVEGEVAQVLGTVSRSGAGESVIISKQGDSPMFIADDTLFKS